MLDVPHAQITAEHLNISFEEYVNQFDLDEVIEIHFCGLGKTKDGKLYDAYVMAKEKDYKCLEYVCHFVKMQK